MIYAYKPGTAASRLAKQLRTSIQYPRGNGKGVVRRAREPQVNWGCAVTLDGQHVLNGKGVSTALSKVRSYELWQAAKLPVPQWSRKAEDLLKLLSSKRSILARRDGLSKGQGIILMGPEWREKVLGMAKEVGRPIGDFYVERLSYHREFRVHVWLGEVIHAQAKVGVDVQPGVIAKNFENGWEYTSQNLERYATDVHLRDIEQLAVKAVEVLGLDFGAVDILINKKLKPYLLEVNTAPGLRTDASYGAYLEVLRKLWRL